MQIGILDSEFRWFSVKAFKNALDEGNLTVVSA